MRETIRCYNKPHDDAEEEQQQQQQTQPKLDEQEQIQLNLPPPPTPPTSFIHPLTPWPSSSSVTKTLFARWCRVAVAAAAE